MRDVARDEYEVERPLAGDLVGDVDVAALRVLNVGKLHSDSVCRFRPLRNVGSRRGNTTRRRRCRLCRRWPLRPGSKDEPSEVIMARAAGRHRILASPMGCAPVGFGVFRPPFGGRKMEAAGSTDAQIRSLEPASCPRASRLLPSRA